MRHKPVICSGCRDCEAMCNHGESHPRELLAYDPDWEEFGQWCTEWDECPMINKKVRCTRVKEAT